jgi:hypothetical protein
VSIVHEGGISIILSFKITKEVLTVAELA